MTKLRYVGTSNWARTLVKDDGTFEKSVVVEPGDTVDDFDNDACEKILSAPRFMRSFVEANGPEDKYGDNYGNNRYDVQGNASAYPELDMGSTVIPGKTITRTVDDNPEGFPVADSTEGPQSDNEYARLRAEATEAGEKAFQEKLDAQKRAASKSSSTTKTTNQSSSSSSGTSDSTTSNKSS